MTSYSDMCNLIATTAKAWFFKRARVLIPVVGISIILIHAIHFACILHAQGIQGHSLPAFLTLLLSCVFVLAVIGGLSILQRRFFTEAFLPLTGQLTSDQSLPIREFENLRKRIAETHEQRAKEAADEALSSLAAQIAHDLRSPLAALDMVLPDLSELREEKRLLVKSATHRIKDIANHLLAKNGTTAKRTAAAPRNSSQAGSKQLISALLDALMTEKRLQFRARLGVEVGFELDQSGYGLFAEVPPAEFCCVISSLINNSIKELGNTGRVDLLLSGTATEVQVHIRDSGNGIVPWTPTRLGLSHPRTAVESWGGRLALRSQQGTGTQVTVTLPRAAAPHWFVPKLSLAPDSTVVIMDDDPSIHQVWEGRFASMKAAERKVTLVHLSHPQELREWVTRRQSGHPTLYLVDYELLGYSENGLDLISELRIQTDSILVTSRFESGTVRDRCRDLGVKLIPKGLAGFVPIDARKPVMEPPVLLIDDDELVHMIWKDSARRHRKSLRVFGSREECFAQLDSFPPESTIFVDSNLGNGVKGEELAKELHARGFTRIYLTTGLDASSFGYLPHLQGICGKSPPWESACA